MIPSATLLIWRLPLPKADQPTSLRVPRETLARLQKEAAKRQWSVSKLVRDIVRQWIEFVSKQEKKK